MLCVAGCVSTDEQFFGGATLADSSADGAAEGVAQTSAPGALEAASPAEQAANNSDPAREVVELAAPVVSVEPAQQAPAPAAPLPETAATIAFDPCGAEGLLLCDTFEDEAIGSFPELEPWLPELSGCGTHRVDESGVSVSGARALLAADGGYPECMLHADLAQAEEVYVRSQVRLGPEPDLLQHYFSLLELGPRAAQDDPELRVGLRPAGGSLCASEPGLDVSVSGLQGGSSTSCSGFALEPERWYCLQAHVKRQGRSLDFELSVDGESVLAESDVRLGNGWNDRSWYLKIGRAAYGESARGSLWHDDVAVSQQPLPCGP